MTGPCSGGFARAAALLTRAARACRLFLLVMLADLALAAFSRPLARTSAVQTLEFLWSVATVVPAVMVIMALFDAWVPRRLVEAGLGRGSGARGMALALLLGSAAAGPLFAAFPIACSLRAKGARLANGVIFLGAWATIKIPMVLLEGSYLGLRFAWIRLALTVPAILAMGLLMERMPGLERAWTAAASASEGAD